MGDDADDEYMVANALCNFTKTCAKRAQRGTNTHPEKERHVQYAQCFPCTVALRSASRQDEILTSTSISFCSSSLPAGCTTGEKYNKCCSLGTSTTYCTLFPQLSSSKRAQTYEHMHDAAFLVPELGICEPPLVSFLALVGIQFSPPPCICDPSH